MSATHNSIVQQIEDLEDERDDFAAMLARVESVNKEMVPLGIVKRLSAGEAPVRVWREYRGLSIKELSDASGVGPLTISLMDIGDGEGAPFTSFAAVARALGVDLDMLVPWSARGEPEIA